jgi:xanthine dehydrogenase small subunit
MLKLRVNKQNIAIDRFKPSTTLLEFLRTDLRLTGTKEGCASGDCGACTVIVADTEKPGNPVFHSINSCITPLGYVHGRQVLTVEGVQDGDALHPVQQAMVDNHGSQCGFCTPGFVMSLVAHSLRPGAQKKCDRPAIVNAIGGNLCRCTGYRSIIAAGMQACAIADSSKIPALQDKSTTRASGSPAPYYQLLTNEEDLAQHLNTPPGGASPVIVAGATDLWLEVTQKNHSFEGLLDVTHIESLQQIAIVGEELHIGGAVTHTQLQDYFASTSPAITELLNRFGSNQIRNRGTIGGNIANASPIADWPPVLLALNANLILKSVDGERRVPIRDFYHDYKQTALRQNEFIARVCLPADCAIDKLQFSKITKRFEDDISSVAAAFSISLRNGVIAEISIAYGGVAPVPVRLTAVESHLTGQKPDALDLQALATVMTSAITPITDVRASAQYRLDMAQVLLNTALSKAAADDR